MSGVELFRHYKSKQWSYINRCSNNDETRNGIFTSKNFKTSIKTVKRFIWHRSDANQTPGRKLSFLLVYKVQMQNEQFQSRQVLKIFFQLGKLIALRTVVLYASRQMFALTTSHTTLPHFFLLQRTQRRTSNVRYVNNGKNLIVGLNFCVIFIVMVYGFRPCL